MNSRCIWLERIGNSSQRKASKESPVEDAFPPLLLILLAGLHAKQPSRRRVILRLVRGGSLRCGGELAGRGRRLLDGASGAEGGAGTDDGEHCDVVVSLKGELMAKLARLSGDLAE